MSEVHATRLVCINQKMCSFYIGALIISAFAIALLVQLKYARAAYRHNTYTIYMVGAYCFFLLLLRP